MAKFIDGFSEAEYSGRTFFQRVVLDSDKVTDYHFTPSRFDKVDVFWDTDTTQNVGEIKFRIGYNVDDKCISEGGAMLEKGKYDELKMYQNLSGLTPYYICLFKDGNGLIYNLTSLENVNWIDEKGKFPKTTMGDKTKVDKAVTYLPVNDAKRFKFQLN